jgi:hypothetical protein
MRRLAIIKETNNFGQLKHTSCRLFSSMNLSTDTKNHALIARDRGEETKFETRLLGHKYNNNNQAF